MSAVSVRSGTRRTRVLQVHAAYVFGYPGLQPGQQCRLMRVVAQVAANSAQKVRPSGPPVNPYASPTPVARRGCQATLPT